MFFLLGAVNFVFTIAILHTVWRFLAKVLFSKMIKACLNFLYVLRLYSYLALFYPFLKKIKLLLLRSRTSTAVLTTWAFCIM